MLHLKRAGVAPDPWSILLELFKRTILASAPQDVVWNRPGISERTLPGDRMLSAKGLQSLAGPVCVAGLGPPFGMRPVPAQAASFKLQASEDSR